MKKPLPVKIVEALVTVFGFLVTVAIRSDPVGSVEVEVEACCCGTIPMAESVTSQVVGFPGDSAK